MADISSALKVYLKTKSAITDLVGSGTAARIFKRVPRQKTTLPFIVITLFEGISSEHLGGISGLAKARVQVDCYAATSAGSYALAELVRLAPLQGQGNLTMDSVNVRDVSSPSGYSDGDDPPYEGSSENLFYHSRDYFISYQEATS